MHIFKTALTVIVSLLNIVHIGTFFLTTSKVHDRYNGQLEGLWKLYIFPNALLLIFIMGLLAIMYKKNWGYVVLCMPLILSIVFQAMGWNTNFVDTSAIDTKNIETIRGFIDENEG